MDRVLLILGVIAATILGGPEQQMESEFYLQARREWDERYGDLVLGKCNWQITSAGLLLLSLILALGIVWMSARTKVIPFVVEVDKLGCWRLEDAYDRPGSGSDRPRQIFAASRLTISLCRGTASTAPVAGLHHRECALPSRFR